MGAVTPYTAVLTRLHSTTPPSAIPPGAWSRYLADAERLLVQHGAALHAAGWGELSLFGIPFVAPLVRVDGAGLAWLLAGKPIGAITPDSIEVIQAGGHALRFYRHQQRAKVSVLPWEVAAKG